MAYALGKEVLGRSTGSKYSTFNVEEQMDLKIAEGETRLCMCMLYSELSPDGLGTTIGILRQ